MAIQDSEAALLAVSDLHVGHADNREVVAGLRPRHPDDWLVVAGDVGETPAHLEWALGLLVRRFARVVWAPGNHELWTTPADPVQLRGDQRYRHLVGICRRLGVSTPEDPYPLWTGADGPAYVVPMFLLYDYTFLPPQQPTREAALARAHREGIVCTDEFLLYPDPHRDRAEWCAERVAWTERRLAELDPRVPTVLVNHFPLVRADTDILRFPIFAQWCGTTRTADWHLRHRAAAVVYGHLHVPRTTVHDGVRFEEVSVGYPREWRRRGSPPGRLRQILPAPVGG